MAELLKTYSLSEKQLSDDKPSDNLFRELSVKIVLAPHTLAIRLGLEEAEIVSLEKNHGDDNSRLVLGIFWKWRGKKGSSATYLALIEALIDEENLEAAEHVMNYYKKNESACQPILKSSGQFQNAIC